MAERDFNCPNCGAPVDYDGSDTPTVRCPFCNTSVIVPAELRPEPGQKYPGIDRVQHVVIQQMPVIASRRSSAGGWLAFVIIFIIVIVLGVSLLPLLLIREASRTVSEVLQPANALLTQMPAEVRPPQATERPAPTPLPTATPTPSFALQKSLFGGQGIGPGLLNNARNLAIDGTGTVYVADYQGGRIQAFDADGKYLHGWQMGDKNTFIQGMAVSHQGTLMVASQGDIDRYDGPTGKLLGKVPYAGGPEFGELAVTADGGFVGVWYEGRWGMITSLQGHREDLVWFDPDGNVIRSVESLISGQIDELALDVLVAVDGLGNIYAANNSDVYLFTPDGKYLDRFPARADGSQDSSGINSIAVDGRGRIFTGSSNEILIFSPDGRFLKSFETDIQISDIAFSESGELYVLSGDQVARYTLGVLP